MNEIQFPPCSIVWNEETKQKYIALQSVKNDKKYLYSTFGIHVSNGERNEKGQLLYTLI